MRVGIKLQLNWFELGLEINLFLPAFLERKYSKGNSIDKQFVLSSSRSSPWRKENLINIWQMFNIDIDDLAVKPYILHKSLLQWICCKYLAWWNRHSYFWPQRSRRPLEAKNTPRRPKKAWKSWFIKKSI